MFGPAGTDPRFKMRLSLSTPASKRSLELFTQEYTMMEESTELEAAYCRIKELERELCSQKHAHQRATRKWQDLAERQKRSNRLTPFDVALLQDFSRLQDSTKEYSTGKLPCAQVLYSSWDAGCCAQPEQEATLLRLGATTLDVAEGLKGNLWHPARGRGNRLSLVPETHSHRLLIHATALRYSTEQTAATCAAAAAAAAWNICCAPVHGSALALGVACNASVACPAQPVPSGSRTLHEMAQNSRTPDGGDRIHGDDQQHSCHRLTSNELDDTAAIPFRTETQLSSKAGEETTTSQIQFETIDTRDAAANGEAHHACSSWPLFERNLLEVYAEQERKKLIASERAVTRALGGSTAVLRDQASLEVNAWLQQQLLFQESAPFASLRNTAQEDTSFPSDTHKPPPAHTALAHACHPSADNPIPFVPTREEEEGSRSIIPTSAAAPAHKNTPCRHSQNASEVTHTAAERVQPTRSIMVHAEDATIPKVPTATAVSRALQAVCKTSDIATAAACNTANHDSNISQGGSEDSDSDVATSFTNYHEHAVDVSASVGPLGHTFRVSDDVHPMKCPGPATSDSITPSLKDGPGRPESPSDGYMTQVSTQTQELVASAHQRGSLQWRALVQACRNTCKHQVNLLKLTHRLRPSTAPIGTLRLMAALRSLANKYNKPLKVWKIFARSRAETIVSARDSADSINEQWALLCSYLQVSDTALIFHLENHYSVIYGIREWKMLANVRDGVQRETSVQQILVGKPGQSPNRWIDWEDVRASLLGWQGYGIVAVQRSVQATTSCETES